MTTTTRTARDAATMVRRNLRHQLRYLSVTVMLVATPIVFLLLFVYVLGGTLGAGLTDAGGGRQEYLAYVAPGVLLLAVAAIAQGTSISVASDMTEGIVARFRSMAISRAAVLTGHVGGAMLQTILGLVVVVLVALAIGLRPTAGALEWLAAFGVLALIAFALTWLAVALGVVAKSVESASNLPMFLLLLPFLGSGFVPTDSMPSGARWVAEHQPFTPFVETVRGLLMGTPIGSSGVQTVAWCAAIAVGGYLLARTQYDRRSVVH
ncbi:ABC transporter permease [Dermatobacter hominis]|uniref:ABC transporter permease n=1 Tax=Dermatobacter hominis TaxID=2884263 RepID=UPI001D0F5760|nr:ABC transporter permease [Dermatobacter hominis]UDY35872.1 ABC transporter permease [Dermatobacter hominis]